MITSYLTALVEMLNNEPPQSIAALKANLTPFTALGARYTIFFRATEDIDFRIDEISLSHRNKDYRVKHNGYYSWTSHTLMDDRQYEVLFGGDNIWKEATE